MDIPASYGNITSGITNYGISRYDLEGKSRGYDLYLHSYARTCFLCEECIFSFDAFVTVIPITEEIGLVLQDPACSSFPGTVGLEIGVHILIIIRHSISLITTNQTVDNVWIVEYI